jgi:aminoglycoside phosphotransferase (APT) family kinase protein
MVMSGAAASPEALVNEKAPEDAPDVAALSARLLELTGEAYAIASLHPSSTGFANRTWFVHAEPRSLAIKVQRSPAYVHERDPSLEPDVLAALRSTSVPVPLLIARDSEGLVLGSPWFAMALVDGIGMPDAELTGYAQDGWFADADPQRRRSIWNDFIDRLADLHSLPAETFVSISRAGSHSALLEYWWASLHGVVSRGTAPIQERALKWLAENAPADADHDPRPCMGDARMANLVERDGKVAALVDWELAHVGNPRGDIGFHLYMDSLFAVFAERRLTGLPTGEATWERWERRTGLEVSDPHYWRTYGACAMAITATRAMRLDLGFDEADAEPNNPMAQDVDMLLREVGE